MNKKEFTKLIVEQVTTQLRAAEFKPKKYVSNIGSTWNSKDAYHDLLLWLEESIDIFGRTSVYKGQVNAIRKALEDAEAYGKEMNR